MKTEKSEMYFLMIIDFDKKLQLAFESLERSGGNGRLPPYILPCGRTIRRSG